MNKLFFNSKRFLVIVLTTLSVLMGSAQTFKYGVRYYIPAESELSENTAVKILYFDDYKVYRVADVRASSVTGFLNKDKDYYKDKGYNIKDKDTNETEAYTYNSRISTSKSEVYSNRLKPAKRTVPNYGIFATMPQTQIVTRDYELFMAFQDDFSTLITWSQDKNSNTPKGKIYYKEISEDDLNYDVYNFL